MNAAYTIKELYLELQEQIKKGNGTKKILITSDDEGNSCHELFFGITIPKPEKNKECELFNAIMLPFGVSKEIADKDYVLLG